VNTISDPELISKKKSECRACVESFSPNDIRKKKKQEAYTGIR